MELSQYVLAAGALGTAAMGIVELFKAGWWDPFGFKALSSNMSWAKDALKKAYGPEYEDLLKSLYRNGRSGGDLPRILRQGVRLGLDRDNAGDMEKIVAGSIERQLSDVAEKAAKGEELEDSERNVLGRFEVAADARVDAALSLAERSYINTVRTWAFVVSLVLALAVAFIYMNDTGEFTFDLDLLVSAVIVGFVAVPLAPIAKDVAKGLQAATSALGVKK